MLSVGIDIGHFSVKLAELHAGPRGFILTRFQEFPLPVDPTKDKKIEILEILRQVAAAYDPDAAKIVMAVRQEHASLRLKVFPFKERHKILRSIAFELEDDIPFSQEDSIFDAKIARYVESAAQVVAVAVPKVRVKDVLQQAHDAGIDPNIVTVEGLALANLLEQWNEPPPTQSALAETPEARSAELILDIGHQRSVLTITSERSLILARNIDFGGKNIADAIVQKYGIHYVEALKELQKKSFILLSQDDATRDQIVFSDVIKKALEPLIHEVRLTLVEAVNTKNLRITSAAISGGTSQIKNLAPYLTQAWEIPVNRSQHLKDVSLGSEVTLDPRLEAISSVAVGIAIEGLKRPRNPATNLLKDDLAPRRETLKIFWGRWAYTAQLLAASFAALLIYGFLRDSFATDMAMQAYDTLKSQAEIITGLKKTQLNPRQIQRFVRQKKQEVNNRRLANSVKEINSALDIVSKLHLSAPSAKQMVVEIRRLRVENDTLVVHGEVSSNDALTRFRQTLQNLAADSKVETMSPLIQAPVGKQVFAYRINIDRKSGGTR